MVELGITGGDLCPATRGSGVEVYKSPAFTALGRENEAAGNFHEPLGVRSQSGVNAAPLACEPQWENENLRYAACVRMKAGVRPRCSKLWQR